MALPMAGDGVFLYNGQELDGMEALLSTAHWTHARPAGNRRASRSRSRSRTRTRTRTRMRMRTGYVWTGRGQEKRSQTEARPDRNEARRKASRPVKKHISHTVPSSYTCHARPVRTFPAHNPRKNGRNGKSAHEQKVLTGRHSTSASAMRRASCRTDTLRNKQPTSQPASQPAMCHHPAVNRISACISTHDEHTRTPGLPPTSTTAPSPAPRPSTAGTGPIRRHPPAKRTTQRGPDTQNPCQDLCAYGRVREARVSFGSKTQQECRCTPLEWGGQGQGPTFRTLDLQRPASKNRGMGAERAPG